MTLVYRKSESLLKIAKETFGKELVVNAWVSTWYDENNPYGIESEAKRRLNNKVNMKEFEFEDVIVIEFINGNRVAFSSSESGSADLYNNDALVEM